MKPWLKYTTGAIAIVIAIVIIKNLTTKPNIETPSAKPVLTPRTICENNGGTWVGGEVLGTCINSAK